VPVFLPSTWAGKKFQSCARRCKKFLQSSDRGSPVRDTSSRRAAEVRAFSCGKATPAQSLMHRRNSSSEFGGDAPLRRPVSAPRRRYHGSFSCALNSERKAAAGNAAHIYKGSVGI